MMMSVKFKRKLRGLWRSRTQWAGVVLAVMVGSLPQVEAYLKVKLTAEDYALVGMVVYAVIAAMRAITTRSVEDKGK